MDLSPVGPTQSKVFAAPAVEAMRAVASTQPILLNLNAYFAGLHQGHEP
jgi:hypothetical protein